MGSFGVKFVDELVKNSFASLMSVDFDKEIEVVVIFNNRKGFFAEFLETGVESGEILVVLARAAIVDGFGGFEATFDIGFGDVEDNGGFNVVVGLSGSGDNRIFFAVPATDRRKDEGVFGEIGTFKIGKDPVVE